jgi:hypothetical protein
MIVHFVDIGGSIESHFFFLGLCCAVWYIFNFLFHFSIVQKSSTLHRSESLDKCIHNDSEYIMIRGQIE